MLLYICGCRQIYRQKLPLLALDVYKHNFILMEKLSEWYFDVLFV